MPDDRVHVDAKNGLASQRMTIETKGGGRSRKWGGVHEVQWPKHHEKCTFRPVRPDA